MTTATTTAAFLAAPSLSDFVTVDKDKRGKSCATAIYLDEAGTRRLLVETYKGEGGLRSGGCVQTRNSWGGWSFTVTFGAPVDPLELAARARDPEGRATEKKLAAMHLEALERVRAAWLQQSPGAGCNA